MAEITQEKPSGPHAAEADTRDHHVETIEHVKEVNAAIARTDSHLDDTHVDLGWRSWLVVLVTMFGYGDQRQPICVRTVIEA